MNELKSPWIDQYHIHSYEIDQQSRLSIISAVNYFQESAWRNAESMGLGFKELSAKNRFWILSRYYIEMYQYPLWGDTIQVETWPKGMDGLFAMRDFRIKSADGEELLGAGTSAWLIIDGTSHRLQRVDHICSEMPCYPQSAVSQSLKKIELPEVMTPHTNIVAGYMDVDVNNHVNNVCYLNWAINFLPVKDTRPNVRSVEINFLAEALLHSPIELLYGSLGENRYACSLRHPDTKKEYCRCLITV